MRVNYTIKYLEIKDHMIRLNITIHHPAFIWFSVAYYPTWKCYINNIPSKIYIAYPYFPCLYIPNKGEYDILLVFEKSIFEKISLIFSKCSLIIMILFLIFLYRQKLVQFISNLYKF